MVRYSIDYLRGISRGIHSSLLILYDCQGDGREEVKRLHEQIRIVENEIKLLEENSNGQD